MRRRPLTGGSQTKASQTAPHDSWQYRLGARYVRDAFTPVQYAFNMRPLKNVQFCLPS